MMDKIKSYYYKDDWDCSQGHVDPFKYHSTFYYFLKAFQVAERPSDITKYLNRKLYFLVSITGTCLLISNSCIHGIVTLDLYLVTEAGTYLLVLFYNIPVLYCSTFNYENYQVLIRAMKTDFNNVCENPSLQKHRKKFFDLQLQIWKASIISVVITFGTSAGMCLFSVLILGIFLVTPDPTGEKTKPLPYPVYVEGVDFTVSPLYELSFVHYWLVAPAYSYNFVFAMQTQIVWVGQIATKAEMIISSIEDLFEEIKPATNQEELEHYNNLIRKSMSQIVKEHQNMYALIDNWVAVYLKLLMSEQQICPSVICLTAYCAAEKLDHGELQLILTWLCLGTITIYFIPSYLCSFVSGKVHSICFACWDTPFWNASKVVRPYLVIMMQRSERPLPLNSPGFQPVSLETFFSKMGGAYSTFNMLRQMNK